MLITDDLFAAFLKCKTKAHLLSRVAAGARFDSHAISDRQRHLTEEFNQRCRDLLMEKTRDSCFVGTPPTQALTNGTYQFIIDPIVGFEDIQSHIHALELASLPMQEDCPRYIPIRFIASEKITRDHRLQLEFDAFALWKASGQMPGSGRIIYGRQQKTIRLKLNGLLRDVAPLVEAMRVTLSDGTPPDLVLIRHCSECEFQVRCRRTAAEKDDLSLLGGISATEIAKLKSRGIFSVTQLSYTFRQRRKSRRSNLTTVRYHHSLKALAIREKKILVSGTPSLNITGAPVYFDVEGIPDREFYYLIGLRLLVGNSCVHKTLWANDNADEERIWREFLEVLTTTENPQLFHYGNYEVQFLRQMKKRYCHTAEDVASVDRLIASTQNILSVIYGRIYFPTYSNGLKEIASFLGFEWSTPAPSGQRSLFLRHSWELTGSTSLKDELIAYNADDCAALELVVRATLQLIPTDGASPTALGNPNAVQVDSVASAWPYQFGPPEFVLPELKQINQCAYWDYQRERIYVRSNPRLRCSASRKLQKKRRSIPVNTIVAPSRPQNCPRCNSPNIRMNGRHRKLEYDLKFFAGGVKRWVSKYVIDHYKCRNCGTSFVSNEYEWTKHRYGLQLVAYVIHSLIELHISQLKLSGIMQNLFGYPLAQTTISTLKRRGCELWRDTYEEIRKNLLNGKLVHADETRLSIKGAASYVWVFTSMEEVVYLWSATRQGNIAREFLRDFNGVLVSDFYPAYDSLDCAQQRCLVHLIRDLNDNVLKEPFNEELRELVHDFAMLLRPIIETIDRFGLKAYFLRKYKVTVARFNNKVLGREYKTTLAQKAQERFRKNQERLFTFLEYDNVPWNNNNAEHAIKAFARLRDVIDCHSNRGGVSDYLRLLSICQTCAYRGIDFLEFLRSGKQVGASRTLQPISYPREASVPAGLLNNATL